jgi:hypothetical protein
MVTAALHPAPAILAVHLPQTIFASTGFSPANAMKAVNAKANANVVNFFIAMFFLFVNAFARGR